MEQDKKYTPIRFIKDKDGDFKGSITAVFIKESEGSGMFRGYAHIGQHTTVSQSYIDDCTIPAKLSEYWPLFEELESLGYKLKTRLINRIITPCNVKYGAPMGRTDVGTPPKKGKILDYPVKLEEGYDKGAAYWGMGNPLRVKFTKDLSYIEFYRVEE